MDDKRIISLFGQQTEKALDAVKQKYGMLLQSIAVSILTDPRDAQECVNDTYMAIWNRIPPEKPEPLSAYICRIARNLALKRRRMMRSTSFWINPSSSSSPEVPSPCLPVWSTNPNTI